MSAASPHEYAKILQMGPALGKEPRAAILLHGRGGSAAEIATLAERLPLDGYSILAPNAANHSWYPNSFLAPVESNQPWLCSALSLIESIVSQCTTNGIPPSQIVLVGFSQGACLACEFAANHPQRYGALLAFTGGLIGPLGENLAHAGRLDGTPVLLSSGDPDPHVPWSRVQETAAQFTSMGASVTLQRHPGRPHTITPAELASAAEILSFLNKSSH